MRPTFSIILFTVLSGAGYGLLFLIGSTLLLGVPVASIARVGWSVVLATGFVLTSAGLLASVSHLGQPLRAWRAFSQWRSSWLSREGVAAICTCIPIFAIACGMWLQPQDSLLIRVFAALLILGCVTTVVCTAHIYSSLPPIRAWSNPRVLPGYLALALYSGGLWLFALSALPILSVDGWMSGNASGLGVSAVGLLCAGLKIWYWRFLDALAPIQAGAATGLDSLGNVRSFEQPHTEENYLTREMGFVLARKHSRKLRAIVLVVGFVVPALLALLAVGLPSWRAGLACLALIAGMSGIFVERWLFFAEAKHAVMAYYAR